MGDLIMLWSVYVKICRFGHSCFAVSFLPCAIKSARRLPVPCSVGVDCGLSS